jgi:RIO kinase 1
MCTMYDKCALVHADLSEYNILYHNGKCYFIDVSQVCCYSFCIFTSLQAVDLSHPRALTLLLLDCKHILDFFGRQRLLDELPSLRELFNRITHLEMTNDEKLIDDVCARVCDIMTVWCV